MISQTKLRSTVLKPQGWHSNFARSDRKQHLTNDKLISKYRNDCWKIHHDHFNSTQHAPIGHTPSYVSLIWVTSLGMLAGWYIKSVINYDRCLEHFLYC